MKSKLTHLATADGKAACGTALGGVSLDEFLKTGARYCLRCYRDTASEFKKHHAGSDPAAYFVAASGKFLPRDQYEAVSGTHFRAKN